MAHKGKRGISYVRWYPFFLLLVLRHLTRSDGGLFSLCIRLLLHPSLWRRLKLVGVSVARRRLLKKRHLCSSSLVSPLPPSIQLHSVQASGGLCPTSFIMYQVSCCSCRRSCLYTGKKIFLHVLSPYYVGGWLWWPLDRLSEGTKCTIAKTKTTLFARPIARGPTKKVRCLSSSRFGGGTRRTSSPGLSASAALSFTLFRCVLCPCCVDHEVDRVA